MRTPSNWYSLTIDQRQQQVKRRSQVSVLGMFPTPGSEGEKAFVEVKAKSSRNHSSIMSVIKISSDKLLV